MESFDNHEIRDKVYTGSQVQMQKELGIPVPTFYYRMAQLFGLVEHGGLDINDLPRTANLLNGDKIISIGKVYNVKIYNQCINEYFKNNPNAQKLEFTYPVFNTEYDIDGTSKEVFDYNQKVSVDRVGTSAHDYRLAILKHMTDLTIDWLSDQRILNLNIDERGVRLYEKMFSKTNKEAKQLKKGLEYWLLDMRNTIKDVDSVQDNSGQLGTNKLRELIQKADARIDDNPFKDTTLYKSVKYMVKNLKESQKLSLNKAEVQKVEDTVKERIGVKMSEPTVVLDYIHSLFQIGSANILPGNLLTNKMYENQVNNGKANIAFCVDKYNQFLFNTPQFKNYHLNPFYNLVKDIVDKGAFIPLIQSTPDVGKKSAYFYTYIPNAPALAHLNNYAHQIKYLGNNKVEFSYQLRDKTKKVGNENMLVRTIFTSDNLEDYKNQLIQNGLNGDQVFNNVFGRNSIANWFDVIDMKGQGVRTICDALVDKSLKTILTDPQYLEKLSNNEKYNTNTHTKITKSAIFKSLIGLTEGNNTIPYGLTFRERSTTIADGKRGYLMKNDLVGEHKIFTYADNGDVDAKKVIKEYLNTKYDATIPFMITKPEVLLSEQDPIEKVDGKPLSLFNKVFGSFQLYQSLINSDARRNGYIDRRPIDTLITKFWVSNGSDRQILLTDVLNNSGLVPGSKINGTMIDRVVQRRIHDEFAQGQMDYDQIEHAMSDNILKTLTGLSNVDKGLMILADGLSFDIAENKKYKTLNDLQFDKDGNVVVDGESYTIFKNVDNIQKNFIRKQNTINIDKGNNPLLELSKILVDNDPKLQTIDTQQYSINVRAVMNAVISRYVYDYYAPRLIKNQGNAVDKIMQNIVPDLHDNIKSKVLSDIFDVSNQLVEMQNQVIGKTHELDREKSGAKYMPHQIKNEQLFIDKATEELVKDGMKEEDAKRWLVKQLENYRNKGQIRGGDKMPVDTNFFKRSFEDLDVHRKDNIKVTAQYLRQLNLLFRNQSFLMYQNANERFINNESPQLRDTRIWMNSKLSGSDTYFQPTTFDKLKVNDFIQFTFEDGGDIKHGASKVVDIKNGKITMLDESKFSKFDLSNIKVQRGNTLFNNLELHNNIVGKIGNKYILPIVHELIQFQSRVALGMENVLFGIRNMIGGSLQRRVQIGILKGRLSAEFTAFRKYAESNITTGDKNLDSLYDIVIEYESTIRGAVDDVMGRMGGVIGELTTKMDKETIFRYEEINRDIKLADKKNKQVLEDMKSKVSMNLKDMGKLERIVSAMDYYYKKIGLFSFPAGLVKSWRQNILINQREQEHYLRDITAVSAIMQMRENWNYEERVNKDPAFADVFRKLVTSEIIKAVYSSQFSYVSGLDKAKVDSKDDTRWLTQFGHYPISAQAQVILAWRNMITQMKELGVWNALSYGSIKKFETLTDGNEYDIGVRSEFGKVVDQFGTTALTEMIGFIGFGTAMYGTGLLDPYLSILGGPVIQFLVSSVYLKSMSKSSPIGIFTFPWHVLALFAGLLISAVPKHDDSDTVKGLKKIVRNMGQSVDDFKETERQRYPELSDDTLEAAYYQKMLFAFGQIIPGMGLNTLMSGVIQSIIMSSYGNNMGEYVTNAINSRTPFKSAVNTFLSEFLEPNGLDVLSTYKMRMRELQMHMSNLEKKAERNSDDSKYLIEIIDEYKKTGLQMNKMKLDELKKKGSNR